MDNNHTRSFDVNITENPPGLMTNEERTRRTMELAKPMWADHDVDDPIVPPAVKARRRARNKQARKARRNNRR